MRSLAVVTLVGSLLVGGLTMSAQAGVAGREIADSGPTSRGIVFITARTQKRGDFFFKGTSDPAQPISGTWSVNCIIGELRTVFHDEEGLPRLDDGSVVRRVELPRRKHYDYCQLTPTIQFSEPNATGELRLRIFFKTRP